VDDHVSLKRGLRYRYMATVQEEDGAPRQMVHEATEGVKGIITGKLHRPRNEEGQCKGNQHHEYKTPETPVQKRQLVQAEMKGKFASGRSELTSIHWTPGKRRNQRKEKKSGKGVVGADQRAPEIHESVKGTKSPNKEAT